MNALMCSACSPMWLLWDVIYPHSQASLPQTPLPPLRSLTLKSDRSRSGISPSNVLQVFLNPNPANLITYQLTTQSVFETDPHINTFMSHAAASTGKKRSRLNSSEWIVWVLV